MASDKTIHKAFRIHETLFMNKPPLEKFFILTILIPKLYFGFNIFSYFDAFIHSFIHSFIQFFLQDFSCTFKCVIKYMVPYKCRESLHYQELTMMIVDTQQSSTSRLMFQTKRFFSPLLSLLWIYIVTQWNEPWKMVGNHNLGNLNITF